MRGGTDFSLRLGEPFGELPADRASCSVLLCVCAFLYMHCGPTQFPGLRRGLVSHGLAAVPRRTSLMLAFCDHDEGQVLRKMDVTNELTLAYGLYGKRGTCLPALVHHPRRWSWFATWGWSVSTGTTCACELVNGRRPWLRLAPGSFCPCDLQLAGSY